MATGSDMGMTGAVALRTDVTADNLEAFIESHTVAVLWVHAGEEVHMRRAVELARVCDGAAIPVALAAVAAPQAPGLPALLGIEEAPCLLVFRERVALFGESVTPSPEGLAQLLRQVLALDMNTVREEIDAARLAREALVMRRACPALRRGPG